MFKYKMFIRTLNRRDFFSRIWSHTILIKRLCLYGDKSRTRFLKHLKNFLYRHISMAKNRKWIKTCKKMWSLRNHFEISMTNIFLLSLASNFAHTNVKIILRLADKTNCDWRFVSMLQKVCWLINIQINSRV